MAPAWLPNNLYPFEGRYLDVPGARLHYLDEGQGLPVVMLHGNPSWSFYYRDLVLALRPRYRCVVPDHVGCGLSSRPNDQDYSYTLERRVQDLETLLDQLQLNEQLTLVLHDWGGMIGMTYAVRHPERIARMVVLNTAGFLLPASKGFPLALRLCRTQFLGSLLVRGLNLFCRSAANVGCKRRPMSADVRRGYLGPYSTWHDRIAIHRFVQDIPLNPGDRAYDLVTRTQYGLAQLAHKPMLIGFGLRDFVFDVHFLNEWTRRFPTAEVVRIDDAGHYVLEDAGDILIPRIERFLAERSA